MRWKALTFRHLLDSLNIYFGALEKFLRVAEVKTFEFFWPKSDPNSDFSARFFKKINFFYCFRLLKRFVCCLTTRVAALESPDLQVPSRYLEHILSTSRKFFTQAIEIKVLSKSWTKVKTQPLNFQPSFSGWVLTLVELFDKTLTSMPCKKFSGGRKYVF